MREGRERGGRGRGRRIGRLGAGYARWERERDVEGRGEGERVG